MGLLILLSACEMSGPARGVDACGPWRPILVSQEDVLSAETARQILAHNVIGLELCGWRANR